MSNKTQGVLFDLRKSEPLGGETISYICKMLKYFFLRSAIFITYQILKSIFRQLSVWIQQAAVPIHRARKPFVFIAFLGFICRAVFCFLCKSFGIYLC